MDRKIKIGSPESQVPEVSTEVSGEVWEPPFDRWMRLTDDLLRDWPLSTAQFPEQRL